MPEHKMTQSRPDLDVCREQSWRLLEQLTPARWIAEAVLPEGDPDRLLIERLDDALNRVCELYDEQVNA